MAEGLLDDGVDFAFFRLRHSLSAQLLDDVGKVFRRGGEVEKPVAVGALLLVDLFKQGFQLAVAFGIVEIHRVIGDFRHELV